jgi:predicted  nucleic acid-binding Zn-ribbon protein
MPGPAVILKELHHLRRLIEDLNEKGAEAPRKLSIQEKRLANQENLLTAAKEHLKNLGLQIRDKEGSVKQMQAQIKKYEKQFDEAANKKEYDALKSEIAQEREHISKAEDEILAGMAESDEKTSQLPEVEKTAQKARADFAQFKKDQEELLARYGNEKARAEEALKAAEATLPDDVRPQYLRIVAGKGTDALAGVKGRICSACYTEVTSQMLSELKREMFIQCKNCGRMLYVES